MIFYLFLNPEQIMLYYVLFFLKVKEQVHIPNVATMMGILKRYLRGTCLDTTETLVKNGIHLSGVVIRMLLSKGFSLNN